MSDTDWVQLCQVDTEVQAEIIRSFLASQGISVILKTFLPAGVYPGLAPIRVFVAKDTLETAKQALRSAEEDSDERSHTGEHV